MDSPDKEKSRPAISDHESTEAPNIVGASNETTPDLDRSASDDDDNSIVLQTDDDVAEKQEEKSEVKLENDSSQDTGKSESEEEKFDEKLENDSTQDFGKSESDTISEKIESEDVDEKLESENINEEVESEDTEQHGSMGISVDADINNGIEEKSDKISKGRKRKASDSHSEAENCIENDDKRQKNDLDAVAKKIKEEPSFDDADLNLPPKETFGKGKRARIPNKRYSDITLGNRGANKSVENGSEKLESENDSMEITIKEEPLSPPKPVPKTKDKVDTSVQKKTKSAEMSDPRFLKPFKFGWRRELVWRATYENKPLGDIYYYTPQGKKIRSMREVADFLRNNKDLTLENFTYFKAPLGLNDPEKETIRDAKKPNPQSPLVKKVLAKASPKSPKLPSTTAAPPENVTSSKPTTPKVLSPKIASPKILSPKVSSPKISSPKISTPKISTPKISTPKIISPKIASSKISSPKIASPKVMSPKLSRPKITSPRLANQRLAAKTEPKITSPKLSSTRSAKAKVTSPKTSSPRILSPKQPVNETIEIPAKTRAAAKAAPKIKVPPKKDKRILQLEETMEVDTPPVKPTPPKKGRWANYNEGDKPCQPCSIRCEGVHGLVPTLQCRLCLCLYHHECVGISPHLTLLYVCKNCQLETQGEKSSQSPTLVAPPPLTPINTFKSAGVQSTTVLPKLQRIPRPDDPTFLTDKDPTDDEIQEMPTLLPETDRVSDTPKSVTPPIQSTANESNKSIVGSVTTWLPHNSKIVDNIQQNCEEPTEVPRPQYVEFLAGRKFLVIPKHNFMSVSPTVAASAVTKTALANISNNIRINTPTVDPTNLAPDPDPDPVTKPTSESPAKPENSQTPDAMEGETNEAMEMDEKPSEDEKVLDKNEEAATSPAKPKKRTIKLSSITNSEEKEENNKFMDNYLQNLSYGYNTLLYVFQYLKVQDLLRAGCVCTMWRDIASHPMLWRTVRMKNSQVHSFQGLANSLKKHGTRHLDLRKMLLPNGGDEIWPEFSKAIEKVDTLRKIELCRCPASVVEKLAVSNSHLEVINAVTIKCESMNLEPLKALTNVRELRLKSTGGLTLTSNLDSLRDMKELRHLSLTSIRDLDRMNLRVIAELTNLESLDLGECTDFPKTFGSEILVKLDKLEKLRLEKGQGMCHTFEILDAVKDMECLEQLELVNFDIKAGFDKALGHCQNIKKLLIIPTYISQSATTNHMVLGGVLRLQKTLSHFVWGVTLELLRVTELFVDQCEEPEKKEKRDKKSAGNGDSIPVLKPVPLLIDKEGEIPPAHDPPQVEILALPSLQKLLMQNLPTTRVKILKIPFHATWRQSITDSVN